VSEGASESVSEGASKDVSEGASESVLDAVSESEFKDALRGREFCTRMRVFFERVCF